MIYEKEHLREISFPLGGIGAGCIGLAGNGALIDWEIFNCPNKGGFNGLSHFAVRAEKAGKVVDYRILNGDLNSSYTGVNHFSDFKKYSGFGWGPNAETMANWPHFRECTFRGEYPFAHLTFGGEKFPAKVGLNAWSVLIPGADRDSSLPCAFFEIELENNTEDELDYTAIGALSNPWCTTDSHSRNKWTGNQLTVSSGDLSDEFSSGDVTLTLNDKLENISGQEYFYRGGWRDHQECYYLDLLKGGRFVNRTYPEGTDSGKHDAGLLASHFHLLPGEKRTVRFFLTWNVPLRKNDWRGNIEEDCEKFKLKNRWKNYYAVQWRDSRDSGCYAQAHCDELHDKTQKFHDELFASSLPPEFLDGISANISVLKSPTCLRLEDGTFYGWEGIGSKWGSCEGSCSHVWNYAQTLPFLFPELEKSMRTSHLQYSVDDIGGSHFRLMLPLGIHADRKFFRPCADGQFGDVMKIYRDWKISGDSEYVKHWWKTIRATIEYAWSPENPDRWDPQMSGVLTGRQHHTLDMELFGPNAWLTGHYLGALKAGAELAREAGDEPFAEVCESIFAKGYKYLNSELFNGEYYIQKLALSDKTIPASFQADGTYWSEEHSQIKYQIADGCEIDAQLAQTYSFLYGLGDIFEPEKDRAALLATFRNNFKSSMRDVCNLWRIYSLNNESGVMICTWPHDNRPAIPLPYNSETMHGFEWAFATHLAFLGLLKEAETVVKSIRSRYDGSHRNPWNEIECGSNYARSMAAFGLLNAYAGFSYDAAAGKLGFAPKRTPFRTAWFLGSVWGNFQENSTGAELRMFGKDFVLKSLRLDFQPSGYRLNGQPISLDEQNGIALKAGDCLTALR